MSQLYTNVCHVCIFSVYFPQMGFSLEKLSWTFSQIFGDLPYPVYIATIPLHISYYCNFSLLKIKLQVTLLYSYTKISVTNFWTTVCQRIQVFKYIHPCFFSIVNFHQVIWWKFLFFIHYNPLDSMVSPKANRRVGGKDLV